MGQIMKLGMDAAKGGGFAFAIVFFKDMLLLNSEILMVVMGGLCCGLTPLIEQEFGGV